MKGRTVEKLAKKYLLQHLPGYAVRRSLLFFEPLDWILRGYCFDSSSFSADRFVVHAFCQPLYVPVEYLVLSFGDRLGAAGGGPERWFHLKGNDELSTMTEVVERILKEGEPMLVTTETLRGFLDMLPRLSSDHADPHYLEARAYTEVLTGRTELACRTINRLNSVIDANPNKFDWVLDLQRRVNHIRVLLAESPESAISQLNTWADYTARQLKLNRVRSEAR